MSDHLISIEDAKSDFLACAAYLAEEIQSEDGQAEAMNVIVPAYLAENNVDLAAELANSVEYTPVRENLLTKVAAKCASLDDDEYALQLIDVIEDPVAKDSALESVAIEKAKKNEFEKALELTSKIKKYSSVNGLIASRMDRNGDEEGALKLLNTVDEPEDKSNYLQLIALEKYKKGETEKALSLLEQAYSSAAGITYPIARINALHAVSHSFGEISRRDRSIQILSEIQSTAEKIETVDRDRLLAEVSLALFEAGSVDLADRALDQVEDRTQTASVLVGYAREYWKRGEKKDALDALHEAYEIIRTQHERNTRDSAARFKVFKAITIQYAEFEETATAIEAAASIPFDAERASALVQIAQQLTLQNKDEEARRALQAIDEDSDRAFGMIGVAIAKNEKEKHDEAIACLDQAAELAGNFLQALLRLQIYLSLGKYYAEFGESEKARQVGEDALQLIAQIKSETTRATALANLSEVYQEAGLEINERETRLLQTIIK